MTAVVAFAALTLCWLALCPLAVAAHRLLRPALTALHAQPRAALLLALALLPLGVAVLGAVLGFAPAIGGWVVDEHCHATTGCTTHVPVVRADALYAGILALLVAGGGGLLSWSVARRLRRSLRLARSLESLAEPHDRLSFEVLESREPFAYCIGFLRPRIVLSRGLIERLSPPQLEVVLRHEEMHALRRDNLRLWLAGLALAPLPQRFKQPLLADLALAGEEVCDRAAAAARGCDRVIETLNALVPGSQPQPRRALATFGSPTTIASRIDALRMEHCRRPPAAAVLVAIAVAYAACAIAVTDAVHHGAELLLALV